MNNKIYYPNNYRNPTSEFQPLAEVKSSAVSEKNLEDISKDSYEWEKLLRLIAQRSIAIARFYRNNPAELGKFLEELEGDEINEFVNNFNNQPWRG